MKRVAHLSTAHVRNELRVHLKECNSLAKEGYQVHYVVADGGGDEKINQVQVHDIGKSGRRFKRMLVRPWQMLWKAWNIQADLYHFHDPELLLIAVFLKRNGAKVIYDSHENAPLSILSRKWVKPYLRSSLSFILEKFENFVSSRLSAVVGATPEITDRFSRLNRNTVTINNYPLRTELEKIVPSRKKMGRVVCYHGGISEVRGIVEIVKSLEHTDCRLILAGTFDCVETKNKVIKLKGWKSVDYRGQVDREEVRKIMASSQLGLVTFHAEPNHINARPNKMFEYMSAGLPVVASNFAMWVQLLEETGAGVAVDPMKPKEIAAVIDSLIENDEARIEMGENGRRAIENKFIWDHEAEKLFKLYADLL